MDVHNSCADSSKQPAGLDASYALVLEVHTALPHIPWSVG